MVGLLHTDLPRFCKSLLVVTTSGAVRDTWRKSIVFFFVVNRVCTAILTLGTVVGGENSTKKKENRIAKSKV